jgi:hypothetical protein
MDSFELPPTAFVAHEITVFLRRNCAVFDHNRVRFQGLYSSTRGKYCCLSLSTRTVDTRPTTSFVSLLMVTPTGKVAHVYIRSVMTLGSVIPAMDLLVDFLSAAGPDDEIVVPSYRLSPPASCRSITSSSLPKPLYPSRKAANGNPLPPLQNVVTCRTPRSLPSYGTQSPATPIFTLTAG